MSKGRISKGNAETIARRLVDATYKPLHTKHEELGNTIIAKCLDEHFGADGYETFRKLPKVFHSFHTRLAVRTARENHDVCGTKKFVVPNANSAIVSKNEALSREVEAWGRERERLQTEHRSARVSAEAIIHGHKTFKALRAAFPEAAEHIGSLDVEAAPLPLVVPRANLLEQLANAKTPTDGAKTA